MKREYEDYLRDMLENAEKALSFVQGMDYAVIRVFEIIGEAAARFLKMFGNRILKSSGAKLPPCEIS